MVINDARQLYVPFLYRSEDYVANAWFIVLLTGYDTAPLVFLFNIHFFFFFLYFRNLAKIILHIFDEMQRLDLKLTRSDRIETNIRGWFLNVDTDVVCRYVRSSKAIVGRSGMPWPDGNRVSMRRTVRSIVLLRRLAG